MKKIISTVLMSIIMLTMTVTPVFAGDRTIKKSSKPIDSWMNPSQLDGSKAVNTNVDSITNLGQSIVKIVGTIGMIVAVVMLIALGIKYMMGSAEEKAEYKKTLLPYVIGAVLIFAASAIATMVYNFASSIQA